MAARAEEPGGIKLGSGEKEILKIWTVEMASSVAQRHASKGYFRGI